MILILKIIFDITVFKKMQPTYTTVKMFEVSTIF